MDFGNQRESKNFQMAPFLYLQETPQSIQNAGALGWAVDYIRRLTGQGRFNPEVQRQARISEFEQNIAPLVFEARREAAAKKAGQPYVPANPFMPGATRGPVR